MVLDAKTLNGEAKRLSEFLKSRIISQKEAIEQICNGAQKYFVGLNAPKKPLGNFLFAGPTGTGKTKIVQEIANFFGIEPVIINCGEIQERYDISKLLGAPPGYIGHGDTKPLLSKERIETDSPNVILFDEIEKASPALFNLLLGILDNGYVTTSSNVDVNFCNCFIFMTCNIGMKKIEEEESSIGFTKTKLDDDKKEKTIIKEIKKLFYPEFINRLDKIIVFKNLTRKDVEEIFHLELSAIQKRIVESEKKKIFLTISDAARQRILDMGYSEEYGARNLKREIEREIIVPLSNAISLDCVEDGDSILVDIEKEFFFKKLEYLRNKSYSSSICFED